MSKIVNFFKKINIPMIAFLAFSARIVAFGASWGDAIAMIALAGLYGYHKYLNRKDILWIKTVEKEITDLKNAVQSVKMKQSARSIYERNKEEEKPKRYF